MARLVVALYLLATTLQACVLVIDQPVNVERHHVRVPTEQREDDERYRPIGLPT